MAVSVERPDVRSVDWLRLRKFAVLAYLGVLIGYIAVVGVPLDRVGITLWILAGLSVFCVGKGWRAWRRMLLDWIPFQAVLLAYDYSYGAASDYDARVGFPRQGDLNVIGMPLHVTFPIEADKWLFGGVLPSQWIQAHFDGTAGHPPWYSVLVTLCYSSHFVVTPLVAAGLWIWQRERFRQWTALVVALAVAGLTTYFVFPMSPPWLASEQGEIPGTSVIRQSGEGWSRMGIHIATQVLNDSQARSNPVAAMPSLHMAYATLVACFFGLTARWWVRALLALYPLTMAFSLVYAGEHYVIDEIVGVLFAVCIIAVWRSGSGVATARTNSACRKIPDSQRLSCNPKRAALVVEDR